MPNYISYKGYYIDLSELKKDELIKIKKELTVSPPKMVFGKGAKDETDGSYKLYKMTKSHIIVPTHYGIQKYGHVINKIKPQPANFNFLGKMRDYQIPIVDKCVDYLKLNKGGLLSIPCGGGKTSIALYIASLFKLKTLVIIHKKFLETQWIDRIKQFTDAKIGTIRRDTVDIEDKDIVIGSIQSISKRDYDSDIFKQFSFIIYDEAHYSASKVFSRALMKTTGLYTLSLSATPYRGDNLIKVMHWFLGKTMYRIKFKIDNNVVVKCIKYYCDDKLFTEKKVFLNGRMSPHVTKMTNNFCKISDRTLAISKIIDELRKDKDRKILIFSAETAHLTEMKDYIDNSINKDIEKNILEKDEIQTRYYIGRMNDDERKEAEDNADIFFATYQMAKDGMDIPRLNTVVLATSRKDVVQSTGRILRTLLKNGDVRPLIIDFSDDISAFKNHTKDRKTEHYNKCKYGYETYHLYNTKFYDENTYNKLIDKKISYDECNDHKLYKDVLKTTRVEMDSLKKEDVVITNDSDTESDDDNEDDKYFDTKTKNQQKPKTVDIFSKTNIFALMKKK